jgi:hypothetical protein
LRIGNEPITVSLDVSGRAEVRHTWIIRPSTATPLTFPSDPLGWRRFPLLLYSSIMAVMAAPIAAQSPFPVGLGIFAVVVLLAAVVTLGYLIGREYVNGRRNSRYWN